MDQRQMVIYYLNRGVYGKAEQYLRHWVLSQPDDIYCHMELIWCFYKRQSGFDKWYECNEFYSNVYDRENAPLLRHFVLAEQMFYEDNQREAIEEYKAAIKAGLDRPTVHYSLAVALQRARLFKEAQEEFEIALSVDPFFLPALSAYGSFLFAEGRFDLLESLTVYHPDQKREEYHFIFRDAMKDLARLRSIKDATAILRRAVCLWNEGRLQEAAITLWPVFREHKSNCAFIRTMAFLFYRNNWLRSGRQRLADELSDEEALARYADGLMSYYEDKHEEALANYNEAIEQGLDHPLVYCSRAIVLEALNRETEEQSDLLYANARQPWLVYARSELAENAFEQSDFTKVLELADLNKAERESALAYDVSGLAKLAQLERLALMALVKQGNDGIALSRIEGDHNPIHNARLMFQRSMVYAASGDALKAERDLSEAIKIDESAIAEADENDIARIKEIAKRIPQSFAAAFAYAIRPAWDQNFAEARSRLEEVVDRFPGHARIWFHIARISYIIGDQHSSRDACKHAISLDPSCRDALELLCRILREEEDMQALLNLSIELDSEVPPLISALDLANSQGKTDQAREIAYAILDRKPDQAEALDHVLSITESEGHGYIRIVEPLLLATPFNFEGRFMLARDLLCNGLPDESLKHFKTLISDGITSNDTFGIVSVLLYGLSHMALDADASKPI